MRLTFTRRGVFTALFAGLATLIGAPRAVSAAGPRTVRLQKWSCTNQDCDPYIYDPSVGDININDEDNPIPPGIAFEDLPDDWVCHVCGDPKSHFLPTGEWVEVVVSG